MLKKRIEAGFMLEIKGVDKSFGGLKDVKGDVKGDVRSKHS